MAPHDPEPLLAALDDLAAAVGGCRLGLEAPGAAAARAERDELRDQVVDYLLPRLRSLDAPLLAVVGGSTGSGKSTLVNSLVGADVSAAGVLRPTTRAPVLVCHRDDLGWFLDDRLLPELPRATGGGPATGHALQLRPVDALRPGVALLDAPDVDSVEVANRELATQLLAAADLWIWVTTAVRYADAVPWEFLARARDRGTVLSIVLNRLPPGAEAELTGDLTRLLEEAGLPGVPVLPIAQTTLEGGRLPATAVSAVAGLVDGLAGDADERAAVVRRTLDGALASVGPRVQRLADAVQDQERAAGELERAVDAAYGRAHGQVAEGLEGGALLRAEVLERWQELIGTGELLRAVQSRLSRARDRITGFVTGRPAAAQEVAVEITSRLEQLVVDLADAAALDAVAIWRSHPAGAPLVTGVDGLDRASDDLRERVGPEVRAWQGRVLDLVREQGQAKRTTARVLALGVNSVGVALMVVLFSQTGGLTGGEVAVASGTATVSQALLTALFGEQAVRDLAERARTDLLARVDELLAREASRLRERLAATTDGGTTPADLRGALAAFEAGRDRWARA